MKGALLEQIRHKNDVWDLEAIRRSIALEWRRDVDVGNAWPLL